MKPSQSYWPHPLVAVGPLRRGRRGWFVLGERRDGETFRPIVAHGVVSSHGVSIRAGVLAPTYLAVLRASA